MDIAEVLVENRVTHRKALGNVAVDVNVQSVLLSNNGDVDPLTNRDLLNINLVVPRAAAIHIDTESILVGMQEDTRRHQGVRARLALVENVQETLLRTEAARVDIHKEGVGELQA